jgi:hypothetical protein
VDIFSVVPIEGIDFRRLGELRNRFTGNSLSHDDWLDIVLILDKLIDYRTPRERREVNMYCPNCGTEIKCSEQSKATGR